MRRVVRMSARRAAKGGRHRRSASLSSKSEMPNLRKLSQSGDRTSMLFSTWETFSRKRYEKGREDERKEGREEREALAKRIAELEKRVQELTSSNGTSC